MAFLTTRHLWTSGVLCGIAGLVGLLTTGCQNTPVDPYESARSPAPLRMPPPDNGPGEEGRQSYEDSLTGGKVFSMYCSSCHNARTLTERPFSNYKNVAAHMRERANLTGKEYAKLMQWLRRVQEVPPPNPPLEPGPKRLIFEQPIPELRDPGLKKGADEEVKGRDQAPKKDADDGAKGKN